METTTPASPPDSFAKSARSLDAELRPKTATFAIRFHGVLIEDNRPEGFPQEVFNDLTIEVSEWSQVTAAVDARLAALIAQKGMLCWRVTKAMNDVEAFKERMFVPMTMIAYIYTTYNKLARSIEEANEGAKQ